MSGVLRITYRKSSIGYSERQKQTVRSLGLRKLGQSVERPDTTTVRGMVFHVRHLVTVEVFPGVDTHEAVETSA